MADITIAKYAGFCFGVKHAVDTVERLIKEHPDARIYTLGKLIHNSYIIDDLEKRGVKIASVDDISSIAAQTDGGTAAYVVVRAHGVVKSVFDLLKRCSHDHPNFHYEDCTCPNVQKIHKIADNNTNSDTLFIVIGSPSHPEVESIVSFAQGNVRVFEKSEDLENFL
ncbi:MAG: 4-hydroxy-3-methylbut-2-enyl diphosphate reductase, partial [Clostridia bacterium]|nr:4-hydroxy-3-methylbut-2-enyl diphosphate reductase [Clostridia bacterium]